MPRYDPKRIESKWQRDWDRKPDLRHADAAPGRKKLYVLDMFPYPSGDGLHVGHPEGYTATDIVCRYNRMRGKHVLHPMGWDAFGLPAEQHAIKTGTHPRATTYKNIDTFRRQLQMLGFSYDWEREFSTTDPDYFRWTQWIFLVLFDTWFDRDCEWIGTDGRTAEGTRPADRRVADTRRDPAAGRRSGPPLPGQASPGLSAASRRSTGAAALGTVLANEEVLCHGPARTLEQNSRFASALARAISDPVKAPAAGAPVAAPSGS